MARPEASPLAPSAAEVVHAALVAAAERYASQEPLIAAGRDRDAVRRGRVGTRRLRSHLRTFASLVDPRWAVPLRAELTALAAVLGDLRDVDVRLAHYSEALRVRDGVDRAGGQAILQRCHRDRRDARARLLARLRSDEHLAVRRRLTAMIAQPAWAPAAAEPAAEVLVDYAKRPWRRLRRSVRTLEKDPGDEQLHAVRIATKRARYAVEALAPVLGAEAEGFAAELARLQALLGTYHDAMISADWLRRLAPELPPAAAFVAGVISAEDERTAYQARDAWPRAWSAVKGKRLPW